MMRNSINNLVQTWNKLKFVLDAPRRGANFNQTSQTRIVYTVYRMFRFKLYTLT